MTKFRSNLIVLTFLVVVGWSVYGIVSARDLDGPVLQKRVQSKKNDDLEDDLAINVGSAGCSASACHGSLKADEVNDDLIRRDEYLIWQKDDPHEKAYRDLDSPLGQKMFQRLGLTDTDNRVFQGREDNYRTTRNNCMNCHATRIGHGGESQVSEGVSCESCHGPATQWRTTHYQSSFEDLTTAQRSDIGYLDLTSPNTLASRCVSCHIGSKDAEVNHDLIAAGHPALKFELTAYLDQYPKHWKGRGDLHKRDDLETWFAGQATATLASLEQLHRRVSPPKKQLTLWPELSEYSCFACHHQLTGESWRMPHSVGKLELPSDEWNRFGLYVFALQRSRAGDRLAAEFCKQIEALASQLERGLVANPDVIAHRTKVARDALQKWIGSIDMQGVSKEQLKSYWHQVLLQNDKQYLVRNWDRATQTYLALFALVDQANPEEKPILEDLESLRRLLSFPTAESHVINSPREFSGSFSEEPPENTNREQVFKLLESIITSLHRMPES